MSRKGPGFIASRYGSGVRSFLEYAKGYNPWLRPMDFAETEARAYTFDENMDFAKAAGITLASVNMDPRNHFGKHALRRFDK